MNFETVIGLEVHAELNTKSKIFCSCSTEFGAKPNENTCPICLGLPGTLPVLNEEVVNLAIKAGVLLNCHITPLSKMDRKNYFYPDLPKAYQISQYDLPICKDGFVDIETDEVQRRIRLNRIHIEEDAGKLVHLENEPYSLIDYNRVGVPLIEIVSEPDMRSPEEAVTFLKTLKAILQYGKISDCKMEQGSLRCDANISVREYGQENYNTKVEIKNINSFKELYKALEKEEKRQVELYTFKEEFKIKQETRRWDSGKGRTVPMRSKEDAQDYRYFPEPDIIPIIVTENQVDTLSKALPEMPRAKKERFVNKLGLTEKDASAILDDIVLSSFFENIVSLGANPKVCANWILGDIIKNYSHEIPITDKSFFGLLNLIEEGKVNNTSAKEILADMIKTRKSAEELLSEKRLTQISDNSIIEKIVEDVLNANSKSVEDFKIGKKQAFGFLMGKIMKISNGKVNPKIAKDLLQNKLDSQL